MPSNAEYWEQRFIDALVIGEKAVLDFERELREVYDYTLRELRREMEIYYSKYSVDGKTPFAVGRRKLNGKEIEEFHVALDTWFKEASNFDGTAKHRKKIEKYRQRVIVSRYEALELSIEHAVERMKTTQLDSTVELLSNTFAYSYLKNAKNVAEYGRVNFKFAGINERTVELAVRERFAGTNYSESIWKDRDKLVRTLETVIPRGMATGRSATQIASEIQKAMDSSFRNAQALARTELNYLYNKSTGMVYDEIKLAEYKLVATLDLRTSDICRHMDQRIFKVSEKKVGVNFPPFHVRCRTATRPYRRDEEENEDPEEVGRMRSARDEKGKSITVPESMTQEEWIKKYAPESMHKKLLKYKDKYDKDS